MQMDRNRLRPVRAGVVSLLLLALCACGSPAPTVTVTAVPPSPTVPPTHTPTILQPTSTVDPNATVTSEPAGDTGLLTGPDVSFRNVQFHLPPELSSGVHAELVPPTEILGEAYPPYVEFVLAEYDSQNTDFAPLVKVYLVSDLGETATQTAQQLKDLLAERPTQLPQGLPILPTLPAGQLVHAGVQYLTFTGGSGIRALTQFAQNAWPVSNEGLVYVFQGLTDDQRYYISAILPVSADFLPDHVDDPVAVPAVDGISFPASSSPDFDSEYLRYQQAITDKLNAAAPESFVPSLSALDELFKSIQIEAVAAAGTPASGPCVNTLPTRLSLNGFAYVNPDPPLPNNLRREAGKDSDLLGEIPPGGAMKVLEGPTCADGWVWWNVRTLDTEQTGWTAEGDQQNYWLVPCASRNECGP